MDVKRSLSAVLLIGTCGCSWFKPEPLPEVYYYAPLPSRWDRITPDEARQNIQRISDELEITEPRHRAELLTERGLWQRAAGNFEAAISDFNAACQLTPDDYEPLFHCWLLHLHAGNVEKAAADRERGMRLAPDVFSKSYSVEVGVI